MSRTTSQTSTASGNPANGLTRSLSIKTNTKSSMNNPLPPSDIKLFVTNLRLIDLDRRPDWPGITVQTFSAKNADQKQRIGAVEWSLFRLFEIWDPVETSQKLQPFFPPLEPLQSRNLRIALHRSLDTLKKDGILGRETVLRKTMLDECKGEKFYEILASFSSIVFKKVLASQPKHATRTAVARTLAISSTLSVEGQASLLPLAIAHKAALANILRRKEEKRRRFAEFGDMLDAKADEINRRIRKAVGTPRASKPAISEKEALAIKEQLKDNWIGDQRWIDVMLHGDNVQAEAAFLNSSFTKVWRIVEQGRRLEDAVPEAGLLENLQLRVEEQKARLEKWKKYHEKMQAESTVADNGPKKVLVSAKEFRFDDHLQLQLRSKIPTNESTQQHELRPAYQDIVRELDDDLSQAASERYNQSSIVPPIRGSHASHSPVQRRRSRSHSIAKTTNSPKIVRPVLSSNIDPEHAMRTRNARVDQLPMATPVDSEATLVGQASTHHTAVANSSATEAPTEHLTGFDYVDNVSDPLPVVASSTKAPPPPVELPSPFSSPPPPSSYFPSEPPILEPPSRSTEEALAAQIVSTIGDATPSPIKKPQPRLSLMERTRMSMVRTTSFEPITESPTLPSPPLPEPPTVDQTQLDRRASLLERTRLSMAAMTSKPRVSLASKEKRKSTRQSTFPVNQFDTPHNRKSFQAIEEAQSEHTPKEELFSDDVDYDRVFKSRPRIATSPVFGTPGDGGEEDAFDEGVTGVDLADVDNDEDEDGFEHPWENSPLKERKGRMFG
ncbi:hypothetical protein N0V90_009785 [Kalmusia sp. IMI 367209]|nr:hypothetical protein N0V90_009785 [Kalmusia sp. IMI 367209]